MRAAAGKTGRSIARSLLLGLFAILLLSTVGLTSAEEPDVDASVGYLISLSLHHRVSLDVLIDHQSRNCHFLEVI